MNSRLGVCNIMFHDFFSCIYSCTVHNTLLFHGNLLVTFSNLFFGEVVASFYNLFRQLFSCGTEFRDPREFIVNLFNDLPLILILK